MGGRGGCGKIGAEKSDLWKILPERACSTSYTPLTMFLKPFWYDEFFLFNCIATMSNTQHTQSAHHSRPRRDQQASAEQLLRSVRQDNPAPLTASPATPQPASLPTHHRAPPVNRKIVRSQNRPIHRNSTVKITSWVKPVIQQEIERLAKAEGLSVSALSASLLEKALQQNLYLRYAALIDPIIDKAIRKHMRSYSNRIAVLLVRSLFASEQTRSIVTNILNHQPGVTQDVLTSILNASSRAAKRNITHVTPQLKELMTAVEAWIAEGGQTNA